MRKILLIVVVLLLVFSAQASLSVRLEDTAALLDENGSVIIDTGVYRDIVPLGKNLFAATGDMKKYALMDGEGALLTEEKYEDMRLAEGNILARRDGLWGLMDTSGAETSDFIYTRLVGGEGSFWAIRGNLADQDSDELFILHPDGSETETGLMVRRVAETAGDGRIAVQPQGSLAWGYCDAEGKLVIPAAYSHAGAFASGRAAVVQDGKYGVIDAGGAWILPAEYDFLEISPSGMLLAGSAGNGSCVFSPDGSEIAVYPGGETFAALVGDAYAVYAPETMVLYDEGGNEILSATRKAAVQEGLSGQYILSDGSWGETCVSIWGTDAFYQNIYPLGPADGRAVYAYMQVNAARYMNDLLDEIQLALDMENARYGVIGEGGEILLKAQYQSIQYVADNRLLTHRDGLWELTDTAGNVYWSHGVMQSEEASF